MLREMIASILIPALLLQIVGCYSSKTVMKEEVLSAKDKIVSVELKDGNNVGFNDNRGRIEDVDYVTGIDTVGNTFKYPFSAIYSLYISVPDLIPLVDYIPHGYDYLVTNNNELFIFDINKPVMDTSQKLIKGHLINGKSIIFPLKNIKGFYKNMPDTVSRYSFQQLDSSAVKCLVTVSDSNTKYLIYPNADGCKYSQQKKVLTGYSKTGEKEIIELNDIKSFNIETYDMENAAGGLIIAVLLGLILIGRIVPHF